MEVRNVITRFSIPVSLVVYLIFIFVAGLAPTGIQNVSPAGFVAFCIATGAVEELVFCGVIFRLLALDIDKARAIAATAVLFGLAHLSFQNGVGIGLLKVAQATAFSVFVLIVFAKTQRLVWPVAIHSAFDLAYFAWPYSQTFSLPPYGQAVAPDANIVVLAGTTLFFTIAAYIMVKFVFKKADHNTKT